MKRFSSEPETLPAPVADASLLQARGVMAVIAVSAVLSLITANECHSTLILRDSSTPMLPSIAYGAVMWLWWGLIALIMHLLSRRFPQVLTFTTKAAFLHLAAGIILSILHMELLQRTLEAGFYSTAWRNAYSMLNYISIARFGEDLLIYGMIFGISGFLHMQSARQIQAMEQLSLEKQLSQAQLQALQMQMEPHFLFNTLNAITSLVAQGRNSEATETLGHLNTILRTTLQRRSPRKVPFTEELRVIESYLAIQKVRFADRLEVTISASSEALQGLIPCFLLQPIVENAIQHGIAPTEEGGLIETEVTRVGDTLWITIRDNGAAAKNSVTQGHGIGLRNTRERLAFFYPGAHEFDAAPLAAGGYQVTIQIPYERAAA
jgi:sensor histidine kinase YesM